jgi:hypothetical protein
MKAKKLDIEFDSIGKEQPKSGYGTAEEVNEDKPEKEEKKEIPSKTIEKKPMQFGSEKTIAPEGERKKMKSVSSTDYEYTSIIKI